MTKNTIITAIVLLMVIAGAVFLLTREKSYQPSEFTPSNIDLQQTDETASSNTVGETNPAIQGACVPKGCHQELCVDEGVMVKDSCTTDPYQLLVESCTTKYAKCERQSTGQCGWTQTEIYQQCMIEISEK